MPVKKYNTAWWVGGLVYLLIVDFLFRTEALGSDILGFVVPAVAASIVFAFVSEKQGQQRAGGFLASLWGSFWAMILPVTVIGFIPIHMVVEVVIRVLGQN